MKIKSSLALVIGAFVFLAFWGVGLASVDIGPSNAGVDAYGYGVSLESTIKHHSIQQN